MHAGERVRKAQQANRARQKEKRAGADGGDTEKIEKRGHASASPWSASSRLTRAMVASAASKARPSATSSTPGTLVALAINSSAPMPPVPSNWTAINLSTSDPRKMLASPTATARTIRPAAARSSSSMPDCLFEQGFVRFDGCRYGLRNVEAMHLKHFAFRARGQCSRLKARINKKGVTGDA